MTNLREAAQMALDALDSDNPDIQLRAATHLRAALTAPPQELDLPKVQLWEFLKLIEGKEDLRGIPLMRTEWPMPEPKAQFEFQEYGPPNWGDSQVTKPEFVAEQKAMNEGLRKMVEQKPVAWRKKWEGDEDYTYYWMNRYKGSEPLYTAPPQREWQGLTDEEYESMAENHVTDYFFDTLKYAHAIEAKLKEKNT